MMMLLEFAWDHGGSCVRGGGWVSKLRNVSVHLNGKTLLRRVIRISCKFGTNFGGDAWYIPSICNHR